MTAMITGKNGTGAHQLNNSAHPTNTATAATNQNGM